MTNQTVQERRDCICQILDRESFDRADYLGPQDIALKLKLSGFPCSQSTVYRDLKQLFIEGRATKPCEGQYASTNCY